MRVSLPSLARPAAGAVGLGSLALVVVALVLHARNAALDDGYRELYLADVWVAVLFPLLGSWLVLSRQLGAVGVVLLAQFFVGLGLVGAELATFVQYTDGPPLLVALGSWVAAWAWTPYLLLPTLLPLLAPRGSVGTGAVRVGVLGLIGLVSLLAVLSAVRPGSLEAAPNLTNPLGAGSWGALEPIAGILTGLIFVVGSLAALVVTIVRCIRGRAGERQRLGWLVGIQATAIVALLTSGSLSYPWNDVVTAAAFTVLIAGVIGPELALAGSDRLRVSRHEVVNAREDERRRMRRDLHDGLGPEMAGIALQLSVVADRAEDPQARRMLEAVQQQLRGATRQVRDLVDELRPAALDELGLAAALNALAERQSPAFEAGIDVTLGSLPELPAAVEVAAYLICAEALTNAARHSGATRGAVALEIVGPDLRLEVWDNGSADRPWRHDGVGLGSMRERAEELQGSLRVDRQTQGTSVVACVPWEGIA